MHKMLFVIVLLAPFAALSSSTDLLTAFDRESFQNPEAMIWPGYFWLWNGPLEPHILQEQLQDMAAHNARSVCMLPLPHAFRPDSTNNEMLPDYLTPEYFERVRIAVEEAARLGMHWWLYDEGGWPSGQALGKVVDGHPELLHQRLVREMIPSTAPFCIPGEAIALIVENDPPKIFGPGQTWTPEAQDRSAYLYSIKRGGPPDLMNVETTRRFIALTHEGYRQSVGDFFGSTIRYTFTDEPGVPNLDPPNSIPWTGDLAACFESEHGRSIQQLLPFLFQPPSKDRTPQECLARIDFYDTYSQHFKTGYFDELQNWAHANKLGSGGHLNGEDETVNAVRYGFGQPLRQLRAMEMPGVDVIWRQLFPGHPKQHHFPKYASSAAHQEGRRFSVTESFCVFGNGLTPAQMKWVIDYQFVRGINLYIGGCYSLLTRDHHMTGERPLFGPANPLWDHLTGFHAYVARMGYALSVGTPNIRTALYYPARDLWAWGESAIEVVDTHDRLAQTLLEHQCDFDLIDDDLLRSASIHNGTLVAGAMRYAHIVCGITNWMHPQSLRKLQEFAASGGSVWCASQLPGTNGQPGTDMGSILVKNIDEIAGLIEPTAAITPASAAIRATARHVDGAEIRLLFNEGDSPYDGVLQSDNQYAYRLDPMSGAIQEIEIASGNIPLHLSAGETLLLIVSDIARTAPHSPAFLEAGKIMDSLITASAQRRWSVGQNAYEINPIPNEPRPFEQAMQWAPWLTPDFSGEVDYRMEFELTDDWAGASLLLETGPIEYAATVLFDGRNVGQLLWAPWQLQLPACEPGKHELIIRVANTLANELTSQRVIDLWNQNTGPGWANPYHKRTLEFEKESRGGGIKGPVILRRALPEASR